MQNTIPFQVYNASAGSGKTFTLVKEYLKILLTSSNAFKFQQILAVTFTNKAAKELKERVLENLHDFSNKKRNTMLPLICNEANITEAIVFKRAQEIISAILQNYSAFNITTIDSFTHKLIRTFAHDLHLPMSFEVEMDTENLVNEAVDIIISKIGEDKELTNILLNYSLQKLDDDKSWDISVELKNFAKIILNENHTEHLKNLEKIPVETFKLLKENLQKENRKIETNFASVGNMGLQLIKDNNLEISEFAHTGELPKHFIKLTKIRQLKRPDDLKFEGRLNTTIEENKNLFSAKASAFSKQTIERISKNLQEIYYTSKNLYTAHFGKYILNSLIADSLIPLAVLSYINNALQELKKDNNILLNAEFNRIISNTIKNEPAPFIYERLGEKFRYYFIDEMQDTSVLQWQNIIPLIDNAISSENEFGEQGKLLLVGDAKQSIYRWRGGKPEQFISLSSAINKKNNNPFYVEKTLCNLDTNFRSYTEIIKFNNAFFTHISSFFKNNSYKKLYFEGNNQKLNTNIGGYVELVFVEKQKDDEEKELIFPKKVFAIIQNLDPSFQKNEVCVLVRKKTQGVAVAKYLSENGIEIISSETLLLKNNEKVNFIIDLLYVLQNPLNKEYKIKVLYFLHEYLQIKKTKHCFFSEFINATNKDFLNQLTKYTIFFTLNEFTQSPFYESIEYIVRSFNLAPQSDSNIQFFLDFVFEYQQKKQASISGFLEFWELKKENLSIVAPEAKNAVRIMTIHKSKGLEFPVVIFPYDLDIYRQLNPKIWYLYSKTPPIKTVLVNYGNKLKYTGKQGEELFEKQREELELDNLNLLYVALTRAVEQLYIVSEKKLNSAGEENLNYYSGYFINYLKNINQWNNSQETYSFGNKKRVITKIKSADTTIIQQSFISNSWKNHNISIVANSSLLWDTQQEKAIKYGNLIHEILSKIKTEKDIFKVVNQYLYSGVLNKKEKKEVFNSVNDIVTHKQLKYYFQKNLEVYTEQEIVTSNKKTIILDRIIVNKNNITILDYKTGKPHKKHLQQITTYAEALKNLNYTIEKKIIVYINTKILVEEV